LALWLCFFVLRLCFFALRRCLFALRWSGGFFFALRLCGGLRLSGGGTRGTLLGRGLSACGQKLDRHP
jgi:hypothetical protein